MKLSIVVPAYNEEENLPVLHNRLSSVLKDLGIDFEMIIVDDGSSDGTFATAEALHKKDHHVQAVALSRNFGHQIALTAGLDLANGDAVVVMDADLQHPPELIKEMLTRWKEGNDVVYTIRTSTEDAAWMKRFTSAVYYRLFERLTGITLDLNAADFRLLDRKVVLALRQIRERVRFLRGLTRWIGYRTVAVPYQAAGRHAGKSKYTFRRMMHFAIDGLVSFSTAPLHLAVYAGFIFAAVGFIYAAYALYARFISRTALSGWTSLIMVALIIGGIQLIVLGIIGIYIGKMYEEVKQRPLYLIRSQTLSPSDPAASHDRSLV